MAWTEDTGRLAALKPLTPCEATTVVFRRSDNKTGLLLTRALEELRQGFPYSLFTLLAMK